MTRKGWVIIAALLSLSMPLRGDVTKVPSSATTTSVASTSAGDLELRDSSQLAAESLTNGALTAGTSWARTNDFALASDAATYTHSAGSGSFQQTSAAAAIPWAASGISRWFSFTYTTSALTGAPVCTIPNTFALTAQTLSTTAGAHTLVFQAMATTLGDFKVSCTSGAAATITFDTLSLKRINGGDLVVNGTLTVRDPDCVNSVLYGTTGGLVSCEAALGYDASTNTLTSGVTTIAPDSGGNSIGVITATNGISLQSSYSKSITDATPTLFVRVAVPSNDTRGGIIRYCTQANSGASFQIRCGSVPWVGVNNGGTETCVAGTPADGVAVTVGTITAAFTTETAGTNQCGFLINSDTSLNVAPTFTFNVDYLRSTGLVSPQ